MKFLNSIVISILLNLIWIDTSDSAEVQALELTPKKIKSIDSFIKDAQSKGYSGYISVNVNGQRVISRATGKRNIEANLPNTLNTVFDFGSNTKQYTAAAIMKLFEAGKLNLNQPLSDFFPDISPEKSVITIHHLLTHTAGFKESSGSGLNALSKADFLKQVLASPLAFEVGERFSYSNVGYGILAAIIEQVSEISYEAYLQQVLFSPLKMRSTGYIVPEWNTSNIATGYYRGFNNFGNMIERYQQQEITWNLVGNGGIQTTASDYQKWISALEAGKVLSESSIKLMLSPHANYPSGNWSYGYGWTNTVTNKGITVAGHSGSNGLFWSDIYWVPELKLSIFFASNAQMPSTELVAREVRNVLLNDDYVPKPLPRDVYRESANFIMLTKEANANSLFSHLEKMELSVVDENVLNRVGNWASKQGKPQWAIALLKKNIQLYPNDGNLYDSLAEAYTAIGNEQQASKYYQKALALAPDGDCWWCENARVQLKKLNN